MSEFFRADLQNAQGTHALRARSAAFADWSAWPRAGSLEQLEKSGEKFGKTTVKFGGVRAQGYTLIAVGPTGFGPTTKIRSQSTVSYSSNPTRVVGSPTRGTFQNQSGSRARQFRAQRARRLLPRLRRGGNIMTPFRQERTRRPPKEESARW